MMQYNSDLKEPVRMQLAFRSLNRRLKAFRSVNWRLKTETSPYEPELNSQESSLYSLPSTGKAKTISEVAEILHIDATEVYYLVTSLQDKKLVAAITTKPIKFLAKNHLSITI